MATIATTYTYVDGNTLVPSSHNDNIYKLSSGVGIMSEANGGLDSNNLASGFRLRREHIQAGGMVAVKADMFDDINEMVCEYTGDTTNTRLVPVGGCACRGYIPFNPSSVRFVVQAFVIPGAVTLADVGPSSYDTRLAVFINGSQYSHTNMKLHAPSELITATGVLNGNNPKSIATAPNWVSHAITVTSGITKGFNEVHLRLFLRQPGVTYNVSYSTALGSTTQSSTMFSRVGFGFRNAFFIAKA